MSEQKYKNDKPSDGRLLSISEISKYRKIPATRLRYYDRIGLLKPDYIDEQTGRRYYSVIQCEKLGTIKELRRLNLSIKEIEEYFNDRNLQKSERILRRRYELLCEEIKNMQEISRVLEGKLRFIEELGKTDFRLDDPQIKTLPRRYALKGDDNRFRTSLTGIEFMKLEESIGGTSPILATDKVAMTVKNSLDTDEEKTRVSPLIFCSDAESQKPGFCEISGGEYLCAFHRNCYSYFGEIIMKMRLFAQEKGYKMGEEGFMIYRVDITLTDHDEETIVELQFPLQKI